MPYFNRQKQTIKTLESFMQYDPKDFKVIIVDDCSPEDFKYSSYPFEVTILKLKEKKWHDPSIASNTGMYYALLENPDIIILQNAECLHAGDILNYAKKITDEDYITFGCYSLGENENPETVIMNNKGVTYDGKPAWFNHPVYRPVELEFCAAITANNMRKLNGYDERFGLGLGYSDCNLTIRAKRLGLKVGITADPFVYHQWHYRESHSAERSILTVRNRDIFFELEKVNDYRAQHIFTPDF